MCVSLWIYFGYGVSKVWEVCGNMWEAYFSSTKTIELLIGWGGWEEKVGGGGGTNGGILWSVCLSRRKMVLIVKFMILTTEIGIISKYKLGTDRFGKDSDNLAGKYRCSG